MRSPVRMRTRLLPVLIASVLCVLALSTNPAWADIVLHDGGVNKDRHAGERVKEQTGKAPTLVLSNDVLSGPTRVLTGNASIEQCEGAPISLDVDEKLDKIEQSVFAYELDTASRSLNILNTLLPCADAPVEATVLARMAFLRGATMLDQGDPLAEKAMAEALAFRPSYEGERGFPRAHSEMLETARRRIETLPDGRLFIWAGPGSEAVFVDGVQRRQEHSAGVAVRPGLHLIQVTRDGVMKGMWVRIRSRFSAVVFPGAGRGVWADGGQSPGGEQAMALMLAAEFRGQQGDIHVLRYRGRLISASTWPAFGEGHTRWDLKSRGLTRRRAKKAGKNRASTSDKTVVSASADTTTSPQESATSPATTGAAGSTSDTTEATATTQQGGTDPSTEARPPESAGETPAAAAANEGAATARAEEPKPRRFRVALGAGYHYADPFSYATLAVDVSFQFFGPLHVAVFLRPSLGAVAEFPVPEGQDPIRGPLSFLPVGGGIGVQKLGRLAPYARIVGQYAHNRDGLSEAEHLGGVMIQGGLDLTPKPDLPLIIRVQGEAGFLGAHFNARLWGGVGLRL